LLPPACPFQGTGYAGALVEQPSLAIHARRALDVPQLTRTPKTGQLLVQERSGIMRVKDTTRARRPEQWRRRQSAANTKAIPGPAGRRSERGILRRSKTQSPRRKRGVGGARADFANGRAHVRVWVCVHVGGRGGGEDGGWRRIQVGFVVGEAGGRTHVQTEV
jgi:hypothetical protein